MGQCVMLCINVFVKTTHLFWIGCQHTTTNILPGMHNVLFNFFNISHCNVQMWNLHALLCSKKHVHCAPLVCWGWGCSAVLHGELGVISCIIATHCCEWVLSETWRLPLLLPIFQMLVSWLSCLPYTLYPLLRNRYTNEDAGLYLF